MKIRLVKLIRPSSEKISFYTVYYNSADITLYEEFIYKFQNSHRHQVDLIKLSIASMGGYTGAHKTFFVPANILPGDDVYYLRLQDHFWLRLFFIVYNENLVIIGSGGLSSKGAVSEDANNSVIEENIKMNKIAILIKEKLAEGEIYMSSNKMNFIGSLELDNDNKL